LAAIFASAPAWAFEGEAVTPIPGLSDDTAPSSIGGNATAGMFDGPSGGDAVGTAGPENPLQAFDMARNAYRSGDKAGALTALQFAAGRGHAGATWMLGRMYAEGDGVSHDDLKAFEYFRELVHHASAGDQDETYESQSNAPYVSNALVWLGSYYLEGIPGSAIKPNSQTAIRLFTDAASNYGDPNAQYNLARIYLDGNGVKRDPAQAVRWLNLASQKNHGPSRALLGHMMFKGEVVKRQPARGLMLMMLARQSAEQSGAADAQWMIELHEKALQEASDEDRKGATSFLDGWLKSRTN
jgi:TPR repeat protein